jgi:hypothetical protein
VQRRLLLVVFSLILLVFLPINPVSGQNDDEVYYYWVDPNNVVMEHYAAYTVPDPWFDWSQWLHVESGTNSVQYWSTVAGPLLQSTFDWFAGLCATGNIQLGWSTIWWHTWYDSDTELNHVLMYRVNCERLLRPVDAVPLPLVESTPLQVPSVADAFTTFCTGVDPTGLTAHIDLVNRDGSRGTIVNDIPVNVENGGFSVPAILPTGVPYLDAVEVWLDGMLLARFTIDGNLWNNQQGVAEYLMGGCQHG